MIYATFDEKGSPTGFYDLGYHGDGIPSDAVQISDEVYDELVSYAGQRLYVDGKVVVRQPSFESLQSVKLAEINAAFSQAAAALTEGYPEAERMTWATQQKEVLAWADDPSTPTPYLDGLAAARGISEEEMRQKTLAQTQLFMAASQQLVGKRQRLRDEVYEATTPEELDAIQWSNE